MTMRPVIVFDDDDQGGFRVVKGELHPDQVPEGWEEIEPGYYKPRWPECRYRRMNYGQRDGRIFAMPLCLVFDGAAVDVQICQGCELHRPPFPKDPTPSKEPDPVFTQRAQSAKEKIWPPCRFRAEARKTGCCTELTCQCRQCPLYKKVLTAGDCRDCKYRQI